MDILTPQTVKENLKTKKQLSIITEKETTSTNDAVKALAAAENEGLVYIAEKQTSGKGRMGRSFYSPDRTGLYMSILLKPLFPVEKALCITIAAAVSAARAIENIIGKSTQIKWVNDIFADGRKVCGILTEASVCPENGKFNYAVLGVGINIYPPEGGFPDDIKGIAGSVAYSGENLRAKLAAEFLNIFFEYYENLTDKAFFSEYIKRSFIIGKRVTVNHANESYDALVTGINEEFELEIILKDGTSRSLNSGEVSIGSSSLV